MKTTTTSNPGLVRLFIDAFAPTELTMRAQSPAPYTESVPIPPFPATRLHATLRLTEVFATLGELAHVTLRRSQDEPWQRHVQWRMSTPPLASNGHPVALAELNRTAAPDVKTALKRTAEDLIAACAAVSCSLPTLELHVLSVQEYEVDEGRNALAEQERLTGRVIDHGVRSRNFRGDPNPVSVYFVEIDVMGEAVVKWGHQLRELCVNHTVRRGDVISLSCYGQTTIGDDGKRRTLNNYAIQNHSLDSEAESHEES